MAPVGNASSTVESIKYGATANALPMPITAIAMSTNKDLFMHERLFFAIKRIVHFTPQSFLSISLAQKEPKLLLA